MEKTDVDRIAGTSPAIAIRQKTSVRNPRSTVGTTTEIHDYMRLLYARVGRTFCRNCGREVVRETAEVVARQLGELPRGTRLLIGFDLPVVDTSDSASAEAPEVDELAEVADENGDDAPIPKDTLFSSEARRPALPPSAIVATIESLRKKGFARLFVDGRAVGFDDVDAAALTDRSTLQVVVDRLQLNGEDLRQRLTDSIETAYLEGGGAAWAVEVGQVPSDTAIQSPESRVHRFSERFECRSCGISYEDPQPRLFSFNNPFGACPTCHGFGNIIELDMDLVVPDATKSINQGAIEPWSKPHYRAQLAELKRAARKYKIRLDVPWAELTPAEKGLVIEGSPKDAGDDYEGVRGFF